MAILGNPEVDLLLEVDRPLALVAVRLCDVAPDGASTLVNDEGRLKFLDNGLETEHRSTEIMRLREGDPLSLSQRIRSVLEFRRDEWRVRVETESLMTADATHFHLSNHMDGYEGDVRVFTKSWTRTIPRDDV